MNEDTGGDVAPSERMTLARMGRIVSELAPQARSDGQVWEFEYQGVRMGIVTDTRFDRMRVVSPIMNASDVAPEQIRAIMAANFHSALDARYAMSQGVLYAVFIHPLSPLQEEQLRSAIRQVATAVRTFGTTYSSGELTFGRPRGP